MSASPKVTAVVTTHREGLLLKPTLASVLRAVKHANDRGITVEVIVSSDNPDHATDDFLTSYRPNDYSILKSSFADPGLSRQSAARQAKGEWIAFVDGDDIWPEQWISTAFDAASNGPSGIVWHPECSMYFGEVAFIFPHMDMDSPDFELRFLATNNYWTSSIFVNTSIFSSVPFLRSSLKDKLGHEDWNWHCRAIEAGFRHKIVPGTAHFIRRRRQSVSGAAIAQQAMCLPHTMFVSRLGSGSGIFADPAPRTDHS